MGAQAATETTQLSEPVAEEEALIAVQTLLEREETLLLTMVLLVGELGAQAPVAAWAGAWAASMEEEEEEEEGHPMGAAAAELEATTAWILLAA